MAYLNDWRERFRLGHASATPFSSTSHGHFGSLGLEWCTRCRMVVDCDTEAKHQNGVYAWKRWCLRCGKVVTWGHYNAPLLQPDHPLMRRSIEWVTDPEKDRR